MSRTDKDRPYRVREVDETAGVVYPDHWHTPRYWDRFGDEHVCDLPERPETQCEHPSSLGRLSCSFTTDADGGSKYFRGVPPRWFRQARFYRPDRTRVRTQTQTALKAWNGAGDRIIWNPARLVDEDMWDDLDAVSIIDTPQHRHGSRRDWF